MRHGACRPLIAGCAALAVSTGVWASTIGVTSGTLPVGTLGAPSGARQQVALEAVGAQLIGRLGAGVVEQIVLTAPGLDRARLIVREIRHPDGRIALHLSADPAVVKATLRATLVLRDKALWYLVVATPEGQHVEVPPTRVPSPGGESLVLPLDRLGSVWLVRGPTLGYRASTDQSARALLGSQGMPAGLTVGAALAFLLLSRAGSRWAHRRQAGRDA